MLSPPGCPQASPTTLPPQGAASPPSELNKVLVSAPTWCLGRARGPGWVHQGLAQRGFGGAPRFLHSPCVGNGGCRVPSPRMSVIPTQSPGEEPGSPELTSEVYCLWQRHHELDPLPCVRGHTRAGGRARGGSCPPPAPWGPRGRGTIGGWGGGAGKTGTLQARTKCIGVCVCVSPWEGTALVQGQRPSTSGSEPCSRLLPFQLQCLQPVGVRGLGS